jgi:hypothetical protein
MRSDNLRRSSLKDKFSGVFAINISVNGNKKVVELPVSLNTERQGNA